MPDTRFAMRGRKRVEPHMLMTCGYALPKQHAYELAVWSRW
jgi:hypothetical protein